MQPFYTDAILTRTELTDWTVSRRTRNTASAARRGVARRGGLRPTSYFGPQLTGVVLLWGQLQRELSLAAFRCPHHARAASPFSSHALSVGTRVI